VPYRLATGHNIKAIFNPNLQFRNNINIAVIAL